MFSKSKVSQSMIDAVNKVLGEQPVEQKDELLSEASPIKEPTSTGMRVYGRSYGNSAKAKQDQTKHELDKVKGPKEKEMKEAAKPDFLDMDKDGNKKETMKKAIADKGMKEELKGNQHKIDANHNDKIDAQDFKILKAKKKVSEDMHFAAKLLETVRKSDVPAYLRKAKGDTPLTVADVKAPKKDSISAPENLAKARNEEVELDEADTIYVQHSNGAPQKVKLTPDMKAAGKIYVQHPSGPQTKVKLPKVKEEVELTEEQLDEMINEVLGKDATAGDWIHDFVHSDNPKFAGKSKAERKKMALGAYYGKQNEATIAGTSGWKEMKKDVKDKSGAVHTPMSRAKDLARQAFKSVQDKTKIKTESKKKC